MNKILAGVGLVIAATLPGMGARAQTARALIVTVGSYKDLDIPAFMPSAAGNEQRDGKYIKSALTKVLHSQSITFTELSTEKGTKPENYATQAHIQQAMQQMQKAAQPGDTIIFYFSGHGSRKGDHFSLCPYDASVRTESSDITDTDLADWNKGLAAKTKNITLILDCCFSEYPTKDPVHRSKFLRRDTVFSVQPLKWEYPQDNAVILKASRNDEEAQQEDETGTGKWVGIFTRRLCRELSKPNADALTYTQLMQLVNSGVKNEIATAFHNSFSQTPQMEGDPAQQSRRIFQTPTGSNAAPQPILPPHLNVSAAPTEGKVQLNAGSDQGVTSGSEYATYPANAGKLDRPTGKVRVTEVKPNSAVAEVVEGPSVPGGSLAVEQIHHEPNTNGETVRMRVEAGGATKSELENALRATNQVTIDKENPAIVLKVDKDNGKFNGKLYRMSGSSPEPTPFQEATAASVSDLVRQARPWISNLQFLRSLVGLTNPNPGLNLKIGFDKTVYKVGEQIAVNLEVLNRNNSREDCYVTLVDIDANGAPRVVFPIKDSPLPEMRENHLTNTQSITVNLRIGLPKGQETLIAIATRRPMDWGQALTPSQLASGYEVHEKGLETLGAAIQNAPLDEWTKSIATFMIIDDSDIADAQAAQEKKLPNRFKKRDAKKQQ